MNLLPTPTSLESSGRAVYNEHTQSPTLNLKSSKSHSEPAMDVVEEILATPDATMKLTSSSQKGTEDDEEEDDSAVRPFDILTRPNELDHEVLVTLRKLQDLENSNISNESLLELKSMILRINLKNTILKNELNREKLIFKHENEMLLDKLNTCQETIISNGILNEAITKRNIKLSKYIRILKNEKIKTYVNENRQLKAKLDHLSQSQYGEENPLELSPRSPLPNKLNTLGRIASVYLGENDDDDSNE